MLIVRLIKEINFCTFIAAILKIFLLGVQQQLLCYHMTKHGELSSNFIQDTLVFS